MKADLVAHQRIACLTVDIEADFSDPRNRIRLFDDDWRLDALIALLREHDVPLTCFTLMSQAAKYLDRLNALAQHVEVEFAAHSYSHDPSNPASPDEISRAWNAFGELWGDVPLGYRAPNCLIDRAGIDALARQGFRYDSSIAPAFRLDKVDCRGLRFGREPFIWRGPSGSIVELPVASLGGIRLPFVLSYVKLIGLPAYEAAVAIFPLPNAVVTYFHPFDLYADELVGDLTGWKRLAYSRNARYGWQSLVGIIRLLKRLGYQFTLMRDLAQRSACTSASKPYDLHLVDLPKPSRVS